MFIPICFDNFIWKGQSVGWTSFFGRPRPVTIEQLLLQDSCLISVGTHFGIHLGGHWNLPEMMLQVTFIQKTEKLIREAQETIDVLVFRKGLADVVHLRAIVLAAVIVDKQDSRNAHRAGGKIKKVSIRRAPDGVKLSFNKHFGALPDGPSQNGGASVYRNLALDEREALILRRAIKRGARNVERRNISANHLAGEGNDVGLDKLGWSHDGD